MTAHDTALVPIEAWCYASPDVRAGGNSIDVGLLAEALIYYDRVYFCVGNQPQFAALLDVLVKTGSLDAFLSLVSNGEVWVYDYSFLTTSVAKDGNLSLWNVQDAVQAAYGTWTRRYLYHADIENVFPHARRRQRLYRAFRDRVIEAKADDFGPAITNAREDIADARRNAIIVQAFVDELYAVRKLGRPPKVEARVAQKPDGSGHVITWNIDFDELKRVAGPELGFHTAMPLTGGAVSNRLLQSASEHTWDLYLPRPMSTLVGDKLYETVRTPIRSTLTIESLKATVEFPDVRALVNAYQLTLHQVLDLRSKAAKFRKWLQVEADRDRDAIIAYHNEVSRAAGFGAIAPRALHLFGVVGGGAVGGAVGNALIGPVGGAVGGAAGAGVGYVADLGASMAAGWKPVIFGDWMAARIREYLKENASRRGV